MTVPFECHASSFLSLEISERHSTMSSLKIPPHHWRLWGLWELAHSVQSDFASPCFAQHAKDHVESLP